MKAKKPDWSQLPYEAPQLCLLLLNQAGIRVRCDCGMPNCWIEFAYCGQVPSITILLRGWHEYLTEHAPPEELAP